MRTKVLNHFHTFHPDAQAEFDALIVKEQRIKVGIAQTGGDPESPRRQRMSEPLPDDPEAELAAIEARKDELRRVIASGVVRIVVKGLTRGEFRRLLTDHPPRDDDPLDKQLGYNSDTFGDEFIRACIVRTENLDGETVPNEWDRWADEMTNGQWQEILEACMKLTNDGSPSFPR